VFHQNDVSNKRGWTHASHHHHRHYFYNQDIDISSRGGCIISVLSCLCAYQNRPEITMTVTTPNGSDSSTRWDSKHSSTGVLRIWFMNQLVTFLVSLLTVQDGRTDQPNFSWGFLTLSFKSSVQNYRHVVLLSAELKKWVCLVRWVDCCVRTMYTYLGFSIRATMLLKRHNGTLI